MKQSKSFAQGLLHRRENINAFKRAQIEGREALDLKIAEVTLEQAQGDSDQATEGRIYSEGSKALLIQWYSDHAPTLNPNAKTFQPGGGL